MPDHSDRAATFDALFTGDPDPWNFETSGYEAAKRRATVACLGDRTFARALEVGCATGALTAELAERCETLIGIDVSQAALDIAKHRLADRPGVNLSRLEVPAAWPEGTFDLIVFSEVLYFLDPVEIDRASRARPRQHRFGRRVPARQLDWRVRPCAGRRRGGEALHPGGRLDEPVDARRAAIPDRPAHRDMIRRAVAGRARSRSSRRRYPPAARNRSSPATVRAARRASCRARCGSRGRCRPGYAG